MIFKTIHIFCAAMTLASFMLRGYWMLRNSALLQHRLSRVLPHVIDTVLLLTGLTMAVSIYGAFYTQTWLLGKLAAVVVYIALGAIALHSGQTKAIRAAALFFALGVFAYIVLVAHTHSLVPA